MLITPPPFISLLYLDKSWFDRYDQKPMGLLTDGEDHHILSEQVNILGPALYPQIPLLLRGQVLLRLVLL